MYIPYHMHSTFSIADGIGSSSGYCKKMLSYGLKSLAITDHGYCFGWVDHTKACNESGIKPILGIEAYVIHDKSETKRGSHAVLLVQNKSGYDNLLELINLSCKYKASGVPRIWYKDLLQYNNGLIITSACRAGMFNKLLIAGIDPSDLLKEYQSYFGDRLKGEIQPAYEEEQKLCNKWVLENFHKDNIWCATDSHYVNKEDLEVQTIIKTAILGMNGYENYYYLWSYDELVNYPDIPKYAVDNTIQLDELIDFRLELDNHIFPGIDLVKKFNIGEIHCSTDPIMDKVIGNYTEIPYDVNEDTYQTLLTQLVYSGLMDRINIDKTYIDRVDYELSVIKENKTAPYFIVNYKIFKELRSIGIMYGPRGSACGSLVAYCLYLHDIDPIKYGIMFERFMTPGRKSLPDIDYDFYTPDRDRAYNIVREMFGEENVGRIATFNKIKLKSAVDYVGKSLDIPDEDRKKVSKAIDAANRDKEEDSRETTIDDIKQDIIDTLMCKGDNYFEWFNRVRKISQVGLPLSAGTHPCGIVVTNQKIHTLWPVFKDKNGNIAIQYDMNSIEPAGGVKIDFLGLSSLNIINMATNAIEMHHRNIPTDDSVVYNYITHSSMCGLFQAKSPNMRKLVRDIKPHNLNDLATAVAAYRPAVLELGLDQEYIRRKFGEREVEYPHPDLEPVLKDTYGIFLYQDHTLGTCKAIGMSDLEADEVRKAAAKKKPEKMAKLKPLFVSKAKDRGWDDDTIASVWDVFESGASYGFNYSHALTYGRWLYITAWVKRYYPGLFYQVNLTSRQDGTSTDDEAKLFTELINDARKSGILMDKPDINNPISEFIYNEASNTLSYSISAVKAVGDEVVNWLKENGPFVNVYDLYTTSEDNKIFCGLSNNDWIYKKYLGYKKKQNLYKYLGKYKYEHSVSQLVSETTGITNILLKNIFLGRYKKAINVGVIKALIYAGTFDSLYESRTEALINYLTYCEEFNLNSYLHLVTSHFPYEYSVFCAGSALPQRFHDTVLLDLDKKFYEHTCYREKSFGGDNYNEIEPGNKMCLVGQIKNLTLNKTSRIGNKFHIFILDTDYCDVMCTIFDNIEHFAGMLKKDKVAEVYGIKQKDRDGDRRLFTVKDIKIR